MPNLEEYSLSLSGILLWNIVLLYHRFFGGNKGCKSDNLLIYTLVCGERGSGLLYKIIKDLYQIISKLSEDQEVTDII